MSERRSDEERAAWASRARSLGIASVAMPWLTLACFLGPPMLELGEAMPCVAVLALGSLVLPLAAAIARLRALLPPGEAPDAIALRAQRVALLPVVGLASCVVIVVGLLLLLRAALSHGSFL